MIASTPFASVRKPSVSLSEEHSHAWSLVASGRSSSVSPVLPRWLQALREREEAADAEREALRELLARRRADLFIGMEEARADAGDDRPEGGRRVAFKRPLRATVIRALAADRDLEPIFDGLCDA